VASLGRSGRGSTTVKIVGVCNGIMNEGFGAISPRNPLGASPFGQAHPADDPRDPLNRTPRIVYGFLSELVKESDRRSQIADGEFINAFEIRLYTHSQFGICHLESIASQSLR
jgi:hypothetical protein